MPNAGTVVSINATSGDLLIDGDPNWDDQVLRVDGKIIESAYTSPAGEAVAADVRGWPEDSQDPLMMGIWYVGPDNNHENRNNFMMSIGRSKEGLMDITEVYALDPMTIKYSVVVQTKWVLVLKFVDA